VCTTAGRGSSPDGSGIPFSSNSGFSQSVKLFQVAGRKVAQYAIKIVKEGFMDKIDALGKRSDRHAAFSEGLLTEANDSELQQIVEKAASELGTPVALVSLVLDQIQFFKAQYGLPDDLAASKSTRRDVSFCQFVVRDGKPFEVNDAPNDSRIPQHLVKEYNIKSYLGIPIHINDTVVGSLCVIDTKKRAFTKDEHEALSHLAELVNERIAMLSDHRRQTRFTLTEKMTSPVLAKANKSVMFVQEDAECVIQALPAIRSFLRLSQHIQNGGSVSPSATKQSLDAAIEALEQSENTLYDMVATTGDCNDCIVAIENLVTGSQITRVSELAIAAQDLARHATDPVGGMPLPDFESDPIIHTPRPLATALVTTTITTISARIQNLEDVGGIQLQILCEDESVGFDFSANKLSEAIAEEIVTKLTGHIGEDPAIGIRRVGSSVRLMFFAIE